MLAGILQLLETDCHARGPESSWYNRLVGYYGPPPGRAFALGLFALWRQLHLEPDALSKPVTVDGTPRTTDT